MQVSQFAQLAPGARILLGPGPSEPHPRVLAALAAPTLGHLDPQFLEYMDEIQRLLREVFRTQNALTFAVSGTGSAGMEACLVNVLEPGDRVVVAEHGVFGGRMADIATRLQCDVVRVQAPFGEAIDPTRVRDAIVANKPKLVAVVHAETSTGVLQPIPPIAEAARASGALLLVDCVTSLGGVPVEIDAWQVDLAYSGTQKCLSCPPGLSPVTFSERAVAALKGRRTKVSSWYFDASLLLGYWGEERAYHHTAPINMLYALREALLVLREEGLEAAHARHARCHRALVAGLDAMGLASPVAPASRMPQLNLVRVPDGIDELAVRRTLLSDYGIEIGGGLGTLKGKVWRVGLMGYGARLANVMALLGALEDVLGRSHAPIERGRAVHAASAAWNRNGAPA
jgi:alanine-glyoxylate transaminase/serine-glyoxylate transaminase/serine-pyruvate transaminase